VRRDRGRDPKSVPFFSTLRRLTIAIERWPVSGHFTISRDSITYVDLVTVEIAAEGVRGRGECRPYARYGEDPESVVASIEAGRQVIEGEPERGTLRAAISTSAGRNAVDCALWDLEAKLSGKAVWQLAGLETPHPVRTSYTLTLDTPDAMAAAASHQVQQHPLLKLKVGAEGVEERLRAVRAAAPWARLVVDANEAWSPRDLSRLLDACSEVGVEMVEQPVAVADDDLLARIDSPIALCADESIHGRETLDRCLGKYDLINIKLDKAGGLTEALELRDLARAHGLGVMVGCMVSTSLSIAPAHLVAQNADLADLDGPLLLEHDRPDGIRFVAGEALPPSPELWG
jgi:L-alanine-DL-glutamate epimerase-like enolase superfamily enzyme